MSQVAVYHFYGYDKDTVARVRSKRPATRDAIERAHGEIIEETGTEVDEAQLDGNGFLKIDD